MRKKLSIVIVTKDTKELLENLLDSIERDLSLAPLIDNIVVIDNASTDGTAEVIREKYPSIVCVRNQENRGFAAAVNEGSSLTGGEYVLFLNSDTSVIEGELIKMVDFMDKNTDVAICGPQLFYPNMRPQRSFAAVPSLLFEIVPRSFLGLIFPKKCAMFQRSTLSLGLSAKDPATPHSECMTPNSPRDVNSLIGAAILTRREMLEMLGGFDERFFFFLEETDLCVRTREKGRRVVFVPEAKIIHMQGKTVRKNWVQGRMEYNISLAKFIKKHHGPAYYGVFMAVKLVKSVLFVVVFSLLFPFLFEKGMRLKYTYYLTFISWYFKGCSDNTGLKGLRS